MSILKKIFHKHKYQEIDRFYKTECFGYGIVRFKLYKKFNCEFCNKSYIKNIKSNTEYSIWSSEEYLSRIVVAGFRNANYDYLK